MDTQFFQHMASGFAAGFASTVSLYPLELIKTRMQVLDAKSEAYSSIRKALTSVVRTDGFFGLYRGLVPAVIASSASWGGYFFLYENFKKINSNADGSKLKVHQHLLSGVEAGSCLVLLFNPLWVVKTRLTLQGTIPHTRQYKGLIDAFICIYKEEGFKGFYNGVVPALLLTSHGAIQFAVYEQLKHWGKSNTFTLDIIFNTIILNAEQLNSTSSTSSSSSSSSSSTPTSTTTIITNNNGISNNPMNSQQSAAASMLYGSTSKIVASILTYPYQVIKSRLQQGDTLTPTTTTTIATTATTITSSSSCSRNSTLEATTTNSSIGGQLSGIGEKIRTTCSSNTNNNTTITSQINIPMKYNGTIDCVRKIWRYEGVRGYFRGVIPSSLRSAPAAGITFVVYEGTLDVFKKLNMNHHNN